MMPNVNNPNNIALHCATSVPFTLSQINTMNFRVRNPTSPPWRPEQAERSPRVICCLPIPFLMSSYSDSGPRFLSKRLLTQLSPDLHLYRKSPSPWGGSHACGAPFTRTRGPANPPEPIAQDARPSSVSGTVPPGRAKGTPHVSLVWGDWVPPFLGLGEVWVKAGKLGEVGCVVPGPPWETKLQLRGGLA
ncbi:hypothetical protein Landi51_09147 [Colletotrichum acutatum]